MKKIYFSLFFLFNVVFAFSEVKFISQDFEEAKAKAKAENKYILVDVYTNRCVWCKKMDATTFKDKNVSNFVNEHMIALKINAKKSKGNSFAKEYGVSGYPTIVYLDPNGELVRVAPGYRDAVTFLKEISVYQNKEQTNTGKLLPEPEITNDSSVDFIYQDLEKAKAKAKAEKKYIIVDVYADWCGWCKRMDATTFNDDEVSDFINRNMIALKINSDKGKGPAFASKYGVSGLPTIVYLDYKGNLVKVSPGYKKASQLLNEIQPYKQKRSLKGDSKLQINSYFKERVNYQKDLRSKLEEGQGIDGLFVKALSFGEDKKTFDFGQFKYEQNKVIGPNEVTKLDVFYLIGKKEYARAFEKLRDEKLTMKFNNKQTEFLVYTFVLNSVIESELLEMVNEISTDSKDIELLNTKALLQYLIGDKEDSQSTIKRIKKLSKKKKIELDSSLKVLESII